MRSVRFDAGLDERVRRAAESEGITVSEFIRRVAAERADGVLEQDALEGWHDFIGVGRGSGEWVARRAGEAFTDLLVEKHGAERHKSEAERRARGA